MTASTVVLDANVVIGYVTGWDEHASRAYRIFSAPERSFVLHPYTLSEVLIGPSRYDRATPGDAVERAMRAFTEIGITIGDFDTTSALRLAALRAATDLRLPDCCPLDAAEQLGATLATFDDRLARVARARGVRVLGVE